MDIDKDTGCYIDIKRYKPLQYRAGKLENPIGYELDDATNIKNIWGALMSYNLIPEDTPLYGVTGSANKNYMRGHANWTNFFDYVPMLLEQWLTQNIHIKDKVEAAIKARAEYLDSIYRPGEYHRSLAVKKAIEAYEAALWRPAYELNVPQATKDQIIPLRGEGRYRVIAIGNQVILCRWITSDVMEFEFRPLPEPLKGGE